jgi:ADP-heptose:LPS heptosyltransferase
MVGDWSRAAVEGNPNINGILSYPDVWIQNKQPLGYLRLVKRLRRQNFDVAYIFHSHPLIQLISVLAGVPVRFGFFDPELKKRGKFLTDSTEWQPNTSRYIADNYLDVPRLAGWRGDDVSLEFFLTDAEQGEADRILVDESLSGGEFLLIAPGGGVNPRQNVFEKRWGVESYAQLCDLLHEQWHLPIVLTGSIQEAELGRIITRLSSATIVDLTGKIPFRTAAALVRRSRMLICNDSAIMHVAVAFGVPSLSVFGPSNPRSLMPVSKVNQWITSELDCSPCYCNGIFEGCSHLRCMTELQPAKIMDRLNEMCDQVEVLKP